MESKFIGTGVALATPLNKDYTVDYNGLKKLINHTMEGDVDYLVVMGTTAESPVFSKKEKLAILAFIQKENNGRKPIVYGLGGNDTFSLVEDAKELNSLGIDGILSVCPYYNRPSQQGLIRHFQMIADASPVPVILYNVPARTSSNMLASTTIELAKHENIIGIKEASRDLTQCKEIINNKPDDFLLISGEDQLTLKIIKDGGNGVISVIANILPKEFTEMVNYALDQKYERALKSDEALTRAFELLSSEGNPTSLKTGLSVIGICEDTVKPPLYEGSEELKKKWEKYLNK